MRRGSVSIPLVVLFAVGALVLGSLGTAAAGGLTSKKVKQIATKVVKKQAPKLSVAKAGQATNAAKLGGKAPSAYLNSTYNYLLPEDGFTESDRTFTFGGLPAGTYLASYSMFVGGTASRVGCAFNMPGNTQEGIAYSADGFNPSYRTLASSTLLEVAGTTPLLVCTADGNWGIQHPDFGSRSRVVFTKVDSVTAATAGVQ
ncbi:hypothetical protein [Nocardioides sp.]|uniref:hypothetical protein n=1 Tax=Nocardioides sp. TaxID=35761 RepID=UPI0035647362